MICDFREEKCVEGFSPEIFLWAYRRRSGGWHFGKYLVIGGSDFGMWWMMGEAGGHYCSKKTDDICGGVCSQV